MNEQGKLTGLRQARWFKYESISQRERGGGGQYKSQGEGVGGEGGNSCLKGGGGGVSGAKGVGVKKHKGWAGVDCHGADIYQIKSCKQHTNSGSTQTEVCLSDPLFTRTLSGESPQTYIYTYMKDKKKEKNDNTTPDINEKKRNQTKTHARATHRRTYHGACKADHRTIKAAIAKSET